MAAAAETDATGADRPAIVTEEAAGRVGENAARDGMVQRSGGAVASALQMAEVGATTGCAAEGGTPRFATAKTAIGTGAEGVEMSGGSAAGAGHPVGDRCRAYKPELVAIGAGYLPSSDKHSSIHGASSQYII